MKALTEKQIRAAFVNCSKGEAARMFVPSGLDYAPWAELDYFGWGDPKAPQRHCLVYWRGEEPTGIVLRRADRAASRNQFQMCSLCHTPQPAEEVALFAAPLAGEAGRNGNTIGTYICADLTCSAQVRIEPPASVILPDPGAVVLANRTGLLERVDRFVADVVRPR